MFNGLKYKKLYLSKRYFGGNRDLVMNRDGFVCQNCGTGKNLCVHHIDKNKQNNNPNNLITLCNLCHLEKHNKYKRIDEESVIDLAKNGLNFAEIGRIFNVNPGRISKIVKRKSKELEDILRLSKF